MQEYAMHLAKIYYTFLAWHLSPSSTDGVNCLFCHCFSVITNMLADGVNFLFCHCFPVITNMLLLILIEEHTFRAAIGFVRKSLQSMIRKCKCEKPELVYSMSSLVVP